MKKILIITNHSYMLWQFRRELIAELLHENEVLISVPFTEHIEDFRAMGCRMIDTPVNRRGINPFVDFRLLCTYFRLLKTERPDLVITYSIKPNIYAGFACARLGIPYCVNIQGLGTAFQREPMASFVSVLYKLGTKKAKVLYFENESNAAEFRRRHIVSRERQTVLHGAGVNLDFFSLQPYPKNEVFHFLYLGRIMKEKGIDELFSAYERLYQELQGGIVLDLVGFFEDEYKEQVEQMVHDGMAVFHGFQSDPRPYYAATDCVVLPSYHEGMSNVLLEAAATGRPLIATDIPGCREIVDDNVTGYLVAPKDSECLYQAMRCIVHVDRSVRAKMGHEGYQKMKDEFNKFDVIQATLHSIQA